jgi:hypothetical protein
MAVSGRSRRIRNRYPQTPAHLGDAGNLLVAPPQSASPGTQDGRTLALKQAMVDTELYDSALKIPWAFIQ